MLARKAIVHNYKSIMQDSELVIDPRLTILVGATESGKTNLLRALHTFTSGTYTDSDLCSKSPERKAPAPNTPIITVHYDIEELDRDLFLSRDINLGHATTLTITRHFDGRCSIAEFTDSTEVISRLIANAKSDFVEANSLVQQYCLDHEIDASSLSPTLNQLMDQFQIPDPDGSSSAARRLLAEYRFLLAAVVPTELPEADGILDHAEAMFSLAQSPPPTNEVMDLVPAFLYVDAEPTHQLKGRVPLQQLQHTALGANPELDNTLRLLQLGGIQLDELLSEDIEQRTRRLHEAGELITHSFRQVWSHGRGSLDLPPVTIRLTVENHELHIWIATENGHQGYPESRSSGFLWFLSFFLSYALAVTDFRRQKILLFDEPGIHLHPKAQRDLLIQLQEMASQTQLIFSTHLCDLIDLESPNSWRLVQLTSHPPISTTIDNEPFRTPKGKIGLEVVSKALYGHSGLGLPYWPRTLLLEGPADQVILDAVARLLSRDNDTAFTFLFDGTVHLLVAHGVKRYPALVQYTKGHDCPIVALFDSDQMGSAYLKKCLDEGILSPPEAVSINDAYSRAAPREIEDLLGFELYRDSVLLAYSQVLPAGFTFEKPPAITGKGLASRVADVFADTFGTQANVEFDKHKVACALKDILLDNPSALPTNGREHFQKLLTILRQRIYPGS